MCVCVHIPPWAGLTVELAQRSPARHHAVLAGGEGVGGGWQAHRLDVRAEGQRRLQLQHGHVVVRGLGVVVGGHHQGPDVNGPGLGLLSTHQAGPHQRRPLLGVVVPVTGVDEVLYALWILLEVIIKSWQFIGTWTDERMYTLNNTLQ